MRAWLLASAIGLATPLMAQPAQWEAIRNAATGGNADAQFALAQAYQTGRGLPLDRDQAVTWYKRAVAQGHARASDELGFLLFAQGQRREAMPYIEKAAARGEARAFYLLGTAHFNGDYATRDWPLAYAQTARAAEAGLPAAKTNLEMMGHYLLPTDRTRAEAILATLPPVRRRQPVTPPPPAAPVASPPAAAPPPPAKVAAPAPPPRATRGNWRVQLGAFGSADRARSAWTALGAKVAALRGLDQRIVAAGSVQRLQAGGLADRAAAETLCRQVRTAGGDCLTIAP